MAKPRSKTSQKPKKPAKKSEPHGSSEPSIPHGGCGAKSKSTGETCKKPAGWGTDHPGQGRCRIHGGATPIKHGRYSSIKREDFRARIERFEADPDPLNLAPEVALLRAFLEDFMERFDAIYGPDGALLAWRESFTSLDPEKSKISKPRQMPDYSDLAGLVDRVGRMVERVHKLKNEGAITLQTLNRVVEQMGAELVSAVQESALDQDKSSQLLENVERRWKSIQLDGRGGGSPRNPASDSA